MAASLSLIVCVQAASAQGQSAGTANSATPPNATTMQRYAYHDSVAAAARRAGDWARYREHIVPLDSILNGHPNVRVINARIHAHLGDTATAYASLRNFAAMGLVRSLEADTDLVALHGTPEWDALLARIKSNANPVGVTRAAFTLPDSEFVAEDIAYDALGRKFFVTSVRRSTIVTVTPNGAISTFAHGIAPGWGMLAVAVDRPRNALWASTEAVPLAANYDSAQQGRSAILRYDLTTGALLQRYDLPDDGQHQAGDMTVAPNGDVIVADGKTGAMYVIPHGKKLQLLVPPGELRSPQGAAVAEGGKYFYVADYARGIARIERSTGKVDWLTHSHDIALNGIDGLSISGPRTLIGVQNGTNPNRILKISLGDDGVSVISATVVAQNAESITEPTHGTFIGSDYYFIANGGYGTFDDNGKIRKGERALPPVVMRLDKLR
jgi:DNA-binding beta-propeller fold protein YncE